MSRTLAAAILSVMAILGPALTAGCSQPDDGPEPGVAQPPAASEDQVHADNLTARLPPESGPFFSDLFVLDRIDLPAGGNISFAIGLGMRCDGNATGYANVSSGWLECSARLARDPAAISRDRRPLAIGFDYQILTQRTAIEPIQWRVTLEARDAAGNLTASFDSDWRDLDLTPVVTAPMVVLSVESPCDWPDGLEAEAGAHGAAELNVSFTAGLAGAVMAFDFGASRTGDTGSASHTVRVDQGEHGAVATFPKTPRPTAMWIRFPVSLETEASPPTTDQGPCVGAVAHETQAWSVTL
ncbi:MAG: hypothetical protein QOJ26_528, partial [Thermoplasmata archaeon]|nr:hypothetical protein [Thermoplasmata archaeon]